jgi:hypothetical protein
MRLSVYLDLGYLAQKHPLVVNSNTQKHRLTHQHLKMYIYINIPRSRLPCGFRSSVTPAVSLGDLRSVWPSHPHFRCRISGSVLIWLVLVQRSLFDIWTGQNMRKILRRHLLIKTCNCFVIVLLAFHVSQPYKRTDFTLDLLQIDICYLKANFTTCITVHR